MKLKHNERSNPSLQLMLLAPRNAVRVRRSTGLPVGVTTFGAQAHAQVFVGVTTSTQLNSTRWVAKKTKNF